MEGSEEELNINLLRGVRLSLRSNPGVGIPTLYCPY